MAKIVLPAEVAAVALDFASLLTAPMDAETAVKIVARAWWLAEALEGAFEENHLDPDTIERPEIHLPGPYSG